jgi:hypothetical protein
MPKFKSRLGIQRRFFPLSEDSRSTEEMERGLGEWGVIVLYECDYEFMY